MSDSRSINDKATTYKAIGHAIVAAGAAMAPTLLAGGVRRLIDMAIDGHAKLPGAKAHAAHQLARQPDHEKAIDALVAQHVALAGAQGFVTNLGGIVTLALSLPANVAGLALVQARMVASIAHLRGYDVDDPRVRTAIAMVLLGDNTNRSLRQAGTLPSTPLGVATAPVADPDLERLVSEQLGSHLMSGVGKKRLALLTLKRVPALGGGIGAATDGWSSLGIARFARSAFTSRRRVFSPDDADI